MAKLKSKKFKRSDIKIGSIVRIKFIDVDEQLKALVTIKGSYDDYRVLVRDKKGRIKDLPGGITFDQIVEHYGIIDL